MQVVYTRRALENLGRHAAAIASDSPAAAREQVARIRSSIDQLARFPEMGREGRVTGTRELAAPRTPFVVVDQASAAHPPRSTQPPVYRSAKE